MDNHHESREDIKDGKRKKVDSLLVKEREREL